MVSTLREADIAFETGLTDGGMHRTADALNKIEFDRSSSDGSVRIFFSGAGLLADVIIKKGALCQVDHQQMSAKITATVQATQRAVREVVSTTADRARK